MTIVNARPAADAGTDQTVFGGGLVTLNGAASTDPDGTIASYAWTQTSGTPVAISSTTAAGPTFTAPTVVAPTTLMFSLAVTDNAGATSATPDTVTITINPGAVVRGRITFDRIPFRVPPERGLDYAAVRQDPARGILVNVISVAPPLDPVLATTTTDADGRYSVAVSPNTQVAVRVSAELTRAAPLPPPHWRFRVRDLDANTGYTAGSGGVVTGAAGGAVTQLDYNIPSGWTTAGALVPGSERAGAPFAILDTIYTIVTKIQQVDPTITFPELAIDWAPSNLAGQTFYNGDNGSANRHIKLSAEVNVDTEEYDPPVIAHEFGHYIEDRLSRSDTIGGPHAPGDRLDMRVAFDEGFATAFAGMMLATPLFRDSVGPNQAQEGFFNIESDVVVNPGWYSEASVQHILWDLYDDVADANDNVALGFAPIWQNLIGPQRTTDAETSVFSFIPPLKTANAVQATSIDAIVSAQSILSTTMDIFGTGETNSAGSATVLPPYTAIAVGGGPRTISSTNQFGNENKLSVHRLLVLNVTAGSTANITVTAPTGRDADIIVWRRGDFVRYPNTAGNESFTLTFGTLPATFVLDVYDEEFATNKTAPAGATPITVTVAQ